jgi:hypothetical protein
VVLVAVLDALADHGYEALDVDDIRFRAGVVGHVLDPGIDLERLVVAAITTVRLFETPEPTGGLKGDLVALLHSWRGGRDRQARAVMAVLSAAQWSPPLQLAVTEALDRPLRQALGVIVMRAQVAGEPVPAVRLHALAWVLRSVAVDQLRTGSARTPIDLEQLVELLLAT